MCECLRDPDPGTCLLACPGTAGAHCGCIHAPTGPHRVPRLDEDRFLREAQVRDVLARELVPHVDDPRSAALDVYAALLDLDLGTRHERAEAHRVLYASLQRHIQPADQPADQVRVDALVDCRSQAHRAALAVLAGVRDLDDLNAAAARPEDPT